VVDARLRDIPVNQAAHPIPGEAVLVAAALQHLEPQTTHPFSESPDGRAVHGHAVVSDVSCHDRSKIGSLLRDGMMHAAPKFDVYLVQFRLPLLAHRLTQHRELPSPRGPTDMRKTRKLKVAGFLSPCSFRFWAANRPNLIRRVLSGCNSSP